MRLTKLIVFFLNIPAINVFLQLLFRNIKRNTQILRELLNKESFSKVIDFGCGEGLFCDMVPADRYIGYDIDLKRIAYAKKHHPGYYFSTVFPTDLKNKSIIVFNSVLHHIAEEDLKKILRMIRAKTNGLKIIVIDPYPIKQQTFFIKILLYIERYIHFSRQKPVEEWITTLMAEKFSVIEKRDLQSEFLLVAQTSPQGNK